MKRATYLSTLTLVVLLAARAAADVPMVLNYQGRLTDPSGTPKNGTFTMSFAVYDAESGGNQLPSGSPWSETQSATVTNGVFNVLLGSLTPLPANLFEGGPSDAAGPLRFLQVTVSGEPLVPRRRISSAAYAINANRDISVRVSYSANISVLNQSNLALSFDSERWDTGNMWDPSSPTILRPQVPGEIFHLRACSVQQQRKRVPPPGDLAIRLNGQASGIRLASIMVPGIDTDQQELSVATHHYLGAADFVELIVTQDSGGPLDLLAPQPNLSDFGMVKLP